MKFLWQKSMTNHSTPVVSGLAWSGILLARRAAFPPSPARPPRRRASPPGWRQPAGRRPVPAAGRLWPPLSESSKRERQPPSRFTAWEEGDAATQSQRKGKKRAKKKMEQERVRIAEYRDISKSDKLIVKLKPKTKK
jgi:hypothetical protein